MPSINRLVIILGIFVMTGCQVTLNYPSETSSSTAFNYTRDYWFWGSVGASSFELYEDCRNGRVFEVQVHSTLAQGLMTVMTLGIYSPRTIQIICSGTMEPYPPRPEEAPAKDTGSVPANPCAPLIQKTKIPAAETESPPPQTRQPSPPKKKKIFDQH
ncbi:hypothetical protein WDW89_01960 [Deltaproteobacteria bacterium TL4]